MNRVRKMKKTKRLRAICNDCGVLPHTMQAERLALTHGALAHHKVGTVDARLVEGQL